MADQSSIVNNLKNTAEKLKNHTVTEIYNSIGSHIFLGFGPLRSFLNSNGKTYERRAWKIWVGDGSSWRMMKGKEIITASEDQDINEKIEVLLGKKLIKIKCISNFFDLQLDFEDEFKIVLFFHIFSDEQWYLFSPENEDPLGFDYSNEHGINRGQLAAKKYLIRNRFKELELDFTISPVREVVFEYGHMPTIIFDRDIVFALGACSWRLLENGQYLIGSDEEDSTNASLAQLFFDRPFKQFYVSDDGLDTKIEFDKYTFETFADTKDLQKWTIYVGDEIYISADKLTAN